MPVLVLFAVFFLVLTPGTFILIAKLTLIAFQLLLLVLLLILKAVGLGVLSVTAPRWRILFVLEYEGKAIFY